MSESFTTIVRVANPRSITSGGWVSFTMPMPLELAGTQFSAHAEGTEVHVCGEVAPDVVKCWIEAPPILPAHEWQCEVTFTDGGPNVMPQMTDADEYPRVYALIDGKQVWVNQDRRTEGLWCSWSWESIYNVDKWELLIQFSDNTNSDLLRRIERLWIEAPEGYAVAVHNARDSGARIVDGKWVLLENTHLVDGQGQAWFGSMIDARIPDHGVIDMDLVGEMEAPLVAMVDEWEGRWGPFGALPTIHPDAKLENIYADDCWKYVSRFAGTKIGPWSSARIGPAARPANTGDQEDFGVCSNIAVGGPLRIVERKAAAFMEARRTGHYRMPDGSILDGMYDGENLGAVCWGQGLHYHPGVSPYQHGKEPWHQDADSHGWYGWDNEHISLNNLCGAYLLTGSFVLGQLIQHNIESWLLGATTEPGWSTTSRGAPRSVGRTLLAMAWCYHCTGDERILARMSSRLDSSFGDLLDPSSEPELYVLGVHGADGRYLNGKYPFWMPWQEALGIVGLYAAFKVTGDVRFEQLTQKLCHQLVHYGWWQEEEGFWVIGAAIAVTEEGKNLPSSDYGNPEFTVNHYGTDFDIWAYGAMRIADGFFGRTGRIGGILDQIEDRAMRDQKGYWRAGTWGAVR